MLASSDMDRAIYEIPGACLITTKVSPRRQPGWSDPAFGLALAFNCHHWKVRQRRMWFDYREVFASVKSNNHAISMTHTHTQKLRASRHHLILYVNGNIQISLSWSFDPAYLSLSEPTLQGWTGS